LFHIIYFRTSLLSLMSSPSFAKTALIKNETLHSISSGKAKDPPDEQDLQEFLYYNLSCPVEWSKYSCAHQQNNFDSALAGRNFSLSHQREILESFQFVPQDRSRLVLIGDSLTRQVFISIACLLDGLHSSAVAETRAQWLQEWPCHGTSNCVRGGKHGGFNIASVRFVNGAEIHFLPLGGMVGPAGEAKVVSRMTRELDDKGFVTMRNETALESSSPLRLSQNDTLLINIGIHNKVGDLAAAVRKVNELGNKLHVKANASNVNGRVMGNPLLWYMATPTQHFWSQKGQHDSARASNTCRETLPENPRSKLEVQVLSPNDIDRVFDYDDLQLGGMHIGNGDCSHYCMPGPPDRIAASIYAAWASDSR
jgi:hypothetical protein